MAGDWIKMGKDLLTHPKVVRMSSALRADRLRTVGGLFAVWCLFDTHSADGQLPGYTPEALDELVGFPGISSAMEAVGWLSHDVEGVFLPRFEEHNGQSAKRRAQETDRKRSERKTSASDADKKRTREEKRREESLSGDAPSPIETASEPTAYGLCSKAMRKAGLFDANPDHPEFRQLVEAGVSSDEFASAAAEAVSRGKGFAYALATVRGRREDAARKGALPAAPDAQAERMSKFAGAL